GGGERARVRGAAPGALCHRAPRGGGRLRSRRGQPYARRGVGEHVAHRRSAHHGIPGADRRASGLPPTPPRSRRLHEDDDVAAPTEIPMSRAPDFLYGTAWKEDHTQALTELALRTGFRGIDTANQRRHYYEAGVGQALAAAYRDGVVTRDDLFLQTKFTYRDG